MISSARNARDGARGRSRFAFVRRAAALLAAVATGGLACGGRPPAGTPLPISLVDRFAEATVENAVAPAPAAAGVEWRFDGRGTVVPAADDPAAPTGGWRAVHGMRDLVVRDGRLAGIAGTPPLLTARAPATLDRDDVLHAVEIRMRASAGTRLGISFVAGAELDEAGFVKQASINPLADLNVELRPGDQVETYILTPADSSMAPSIPFARLGHVVLRPTNEEGAEIEIESVKMVGRREHLAAMSSGIGWHGLGEIYRETIASRAPERISFEVDLPADSHLDLAIGTLDDGPVTFGVEVEPASGQPSEVLRRTVSTPRRWESLRVVLPSRAGRARLTLALEAPEAGALGFWGAPVVRVAGARPAVAASSAARDALAGRDAPPPQGVIVVLIDTLRRDHLEPWGATRPTAPVVSRLVAEGAVFRDAIAQGAWTKVSATSILTSLYPSTHGVADMPDRVPAAVTALAEVYRQAGYATFATSSVPFTGKLTNLQQGVEVLHEASSLVEDSGADAIVAGAAADSTSKTARQFVDRLLPWLEAHRDVPFFAFLHVFDPHSPFEPYPPYDRLWLDAEAIARHRENMEKVTAQIDYPFFKVQALPTRAELERSGVDPETYLDAERAWYDASIRGLDVELGRLLERLRELGLGDRTLIALLADHGEEFLEHGRSFHGYSAYGEMVNVPLVLWWPGVVPAGTAVDETVETIDVFPTLLELARLEVPPAAQGQSLVPLLTGSRARELGWRARPAFAERAWAPGAFADEVDPLSQLAMVADGWKLIRNTQRPAGRAEFELYDHRADPLNLRDVAADHPDLVERMASQLDAWHREALAARVESETGDIAPAELERLRSLGYVR
jgi:arylsulfatase A-like enzyme